MKNDVKNIYIVRRYLYSGNRVLDTTKMLRGIAAIGYHYDPKVQPRRGWKEDIQKPKIEDNHDVQDSLNNILFKEIYDVQNENIQIAIQLVEKADNA